MPSFETASPALMDQLQLLWDEMADFDVARHDEALEHLLRALTLLLDADRAGWYAAVRVAPGSGQERPATWGPRLLHVHERHPGGAGAGEPLPWDHAVSAGCLRDAAFGGKLHAHRLAQSPGQPQTPSPNRSDADVLLIVCPVDADAEVHFSFWRRAGRPPFTAAEHDLAATALRSMRWFHRQYLVSHGLLPAGAFGDAEHPAEMGTRALNANEVAPNFPKAVP